MIKCRLTENIHKSNHQNVLKKHKPTKNIQKNKYENILYLMHVYKNKYVKLKKSQIDIL
ncbi:hypothetical protein HanIR_Chr11g0508031 [Helianthus annuus]|nr:hypothetical protein HanIR_Chr11g0508031 [Helianthus annuus]